MVYKILNGHVILESELLPKFKNHPPMRECNYATVGRKNQLKEPQPNLQITENTFFFAIPKIWNQRVSEKQAEAPSVDNFKQYFDKE